MVTGSSVALGGFADADGLALLELDDAVRLRERGLDAARSCCSKACSTRRHRRGSRRSA